MRRRKLTTEQKQAAAERLAAARAKKGEPSYSQYCQAVVNLPPDHYLSFKTVRSWIKSNREKLPMLKKAVRNKDKGSIMRMSMVQGYISNMESYLRTGLWLDMFYGEDQEYATGWLKYGTIFEAQQHACNNPAVQ
tara:strand:- start:49 stop:453 length:405 start_codon:yes stop_codon:yes gene_type:complete